MLKSDEQVIDLLLEYLKQKEMLLDWEKDVLSTINIYRMIPFDRDAGKKKDIENNSKYPDICLSIHMVEGRTSKPFDQASDEDIRCNLKWQIEIMCVKALDKGKK